VIIFGGSVFENGFLAKLAKDIDSGNGFSLLGRFHILIMGVWGFFLLFPGARPRDYHKKFL